MTEQNTEYNHSAATLPVATPPTYLLLIDSRVSNYQDIINSKKSGVYHIVFDAPTTRPTHSSKLIKNIEDKIAELGVSAFTSIGLVQHNDGRPIYEMFGRTSDRMKPVIHAVETVDADIQSWNSISLFITMLRLNYGIQYFDMMACALYSNPDWKYVIDKLTDKTGVTIRASTDDTGAASLGGDWFLESHIGVNLKSVYFSDSIENYNGLLYTAPTSGTGTGTGTGTKKLILIDNRIKDIDVIINSMNDDTYCLVFNYFYDTPETILSKLRFLSGANRYILDNFYYEPPTLPTRMDASGNHCTPCDDFDTNEVQLVPAVLENEYMAYTMAGTDVSGGVWPFYNESTGITIHKPVFFQRAKIGETEEIVPHGSTEMTMAVLNYKPRPAVLISDLDAFYQLGQNAGEISGNILFDCVGIIQHTVEPSIGYKFIGGSDDSIEPAIIQDVQSRDPNLASWASFTSFIQTLKTAYQMTTLDLMACALYANPDWKYVIDTLAVRENITIRASLDNTGSAADEGNWVLETNNVSLTTVYFTDKIYEWKYVLATYIDSRFYALRWNDSMYSTRGYDSRFKIAAGTNNFTIETWYYETTARYNCTIVDMGNYNYTFQIRNLNVTNAVGLSFTNLNYSGGGSWLYAESAVVPVAQWSHLAITRSGSTFTFYVNGVARQSFTNSTSLYSNDSTFAIGWQSPDTCQCNRQKLDTVLYDIRLWNVARTASEIQMNRNRIVPANTTGLVANYLCTDNTTTLNDRTSNALHTTIQNYSAARWSNSTVPIPNIGFLINNGYSLTTSNTSTALNAFTHFDNITYTDFSGVDLSGVNFRGADLTGCNFTNANLTNTNFTNAYLVSATTTNAITTGSNISQAITNLTSTVLNFDGVDDSVILGVPAWSYTTQFRTTMTVECWFKTADTNNQKVYTTLVGRNRTGGVSTDSQFSIYMQPTGEIGFGITNTSNSISYHNTTATYKDALWHHVAATYNSSTGAKIIYIDGVLARNDTVTAGFGLLSNNSVTQLLFGSDDWSIVGGADRQFRGAISDIRIWNVVRSASEIAANYQSRLIGTETGLVGYWKLNQGYGTGWGSYSKALDSTSNRAHGTLTNMGATPSANWVVSNINFQPRISTLRLGANNGVYNLTDSSFSFIDPSSNSLGDFTYAVTPSSIASVSNGAATTKTLYASSGATVTIPTLTTYEFPEIASLSSWQIDISFTVTGGTNTWRALVGDMYNEINSSRGWGLWVSSGNRIHWSWVGAVSEPTTISVSLNIPYVLTVTQSSGTITLTLRTVSSGATQTGSFSVGSNVIGKGPVTIGGWRSLTSENFPGTISYVNVSVPTNQRVVTLSSATSGTPATVTATQASLLDLSIGTQTASLTVNKINPTIGTLTVPAKNFGDASFNLTDPTSNSNGAFSYTSSNTSVATVTTGGTVTIVGAGTTTITASQAATASYNTGSVTGTLTVSSVAPTIGTLTVPAKNFGDASFNLTAPTSNSNGAFSYTSSNTSVATVTTGGVVTVVGAGTTTITATQAATTNYTTGSVTGTLTVSSVAPTIGTLTVPAKNFGDASFNLTAPTSNSNGAFSYTSSNASVATVTTGGTVTIVGAGTTTITATQAATTNYTSGSVTGTLTVSSVAPTIGTLTVPAKNFGDASFNLTAPTSNSNGAFSYTSSNTSVATVTTGGTVTIVGAGTTTITATQAATTNYTSGSVTGTLTVSSVAPTIGTLTVPAKNFGDASFNLTAPTSNSNGAFSYTSSNASVATVTTGGTVTIVGAGTTTITASQAATTNYTTGSVTGSLVVSSIAPNIGTLTVPAKNFGDASFNLTAPTSNSNGAFSYTSSNASVATVTTGGVVTVVGAGTTTITATQAATTNYITGSVTGTLTVSSVAPTIGTLTVPAKNFGDASFNLTAPTSDSNGAFSYTSSNASVATVTTGGVVTVVGAGSATITATQAATTNYTSGSVTGSLVVSSIAPTIGTLTVPAKNFGDASFNITDPTSNSNGAFSYTSSNASVATVTTGGVVTVVGAGSATITATQAATTNYTTGSVTGSLVVSSIAPTIGTLTVPAKNFGDASFNITDPTSNSNGAFSYTSSNASVATVTTGGVVTVVGAGTTTITATQAATTNYTSGSVTGSLVVSSIVPNIGTLTVPAKNFGDASFNLTAPTSNSNGAFTYTSSNPAVATVTTGGVVTVVGAGSATITATQAATTNYTTGSVTGSLVVSSIAPTIGTLTVPAKNFGDASFNITDPTSNSNGAFSYTSSNASVATVTTGGVVTVVGAGTTTITATQAATTNYTSGSVTGSLVVSSIVPNIGTLTVPAKNFGDASFNLTAPTSNSNGAFTYTSSNPAVATVTTGGVVTVVGAGSATITATQAATTNYTTGSVTGSLVVSSIAPTIGTLTVPAKNFGDASFNLTAPSSNSNGAFTYTSSNPAVATVTTGGVVTVVGAGSATITATQAATTNYTTGSVTGSLVVSSIAPTIGTLTVPAKNFGDASFNLTAPSSNSNGAFTYTSSNPAVATVTTGGVVTVVGVGSATITATQEASGNFISGSVAGVLVVSPIAPTIGTLTVPAKNFRDASFTLTAPTSDSSGAFTYTSSNGFVATVTSSGVVTVVGAGSALITASQEASGNFISGSVVGVLVVSPIAPTYQSISQITKTYSTDVSFSLAAIVEGVSDSSGAFTFSTTSNAIEISGGVATIVAYTPSAITITASQAASGNYTLGSTTFLLLVNRKTPSYGPFSIPAKTFGDATFSVAAYAPTTDSVHVPLTYTSSDPTVATINSSGTTVTIIGQGYTTITASQEASGNYAAGSVTTSFLVNRAAPTFLKSFTIPNKTFGDAPFSLLPFTDGLDNTDGTYHFTSSNAQLVSISNIDGVTATIHAYTPTPITIYVAIDACGNYAASSTSGTLTVNRATPNIGTLTVPAKNFRDASFTLTRPTSDSSGAFSYTSSNTSVATVTSSTGTVTILKAGSTTITASQDICGNYTTGSVSAALVVSPIAPTFGTFTIPGKNIYDTSFNLTPPTSDSSGAFTYTSDASGVATVTSGGVVTIIGVGTANITATQAASADGNYTSGSISGSLVVTAELSNFTVPAKNYGDSPFDLTDPTSIYSGEPFTFTSSDTSVASIGGAGGRTVTIHKAGSTTIRATQAATGAHQELNISAILVVSRITPVITVSAISKNYGDASFNISPSSTNTDLIGSGYSGDGLGGGLFSYSSRNSSVVSIFDTSNVSMTGIGSTIIDVTLSATTNFTSATATIAVTISKGTPVLSVFTVSATRTFGSAPFSALAYPTSASSGAITYSSSDSTVATIDSSGIITLVAAGYVNFTATQAATEFYNSTTKTSNTMTVNRRPIPLTRSSPTTSTINKTYGDPYFTVSATNESNGGTITYATNNPSVAGIVGPATSGVVSVVSVGTATITASREQTAQYTSIPVSWTVEVARTTTTLTGLSDLSYNVTAAPFTVSASSASDGAVTYSLQDPSSTVLTVDPTSGLVTLRSPGTAVIVASQAQGTLYLAPASITATITVTSAGNALQGATITNTTSFESVNLEGASLSGVSITNTTFSEAKLSNANLTNAVIVSANFASADLSGATLAGATITGATFTAASLKNADLSGAVLTNTVFSGSNLTGANLSGVDASGASFANAKLNNVDLTGANIANVNFTNTSIKGAIIADVSFSPLQKLQLLKNSENRDIGQIIIPEVTGTTVLAAISESSPLRSIPNLDLTTSTVAVVIPETSTSPTAVLPDVVLNVTESDKFYLPINESEYFQIEGVKYYATGGVVRNFATNAVVEVISYNGTPVWLIAGSIVGLVLQTNTLNTASFVVPSRVLYTDTTPFMPTSLPTSNNTETPIVYSSSNPNIATIDASSGQITVTGISTGEVRFTATQVQTATYGPGTKTSNSMLVDRSIHIALSGLNQTFNLSTLATLDSSSVNMDATDATAIFYVRLSSLTNVFKYQSDSIDINNVSDYDIKYYVFHSK